MYIVGVALTGQHGDKVATDMITSASYEVAHAWFVQHSRTT